ncbi:MAG TPA: hypothetical protein VMT64_03955 [Candidatus Binataceae bacterium]|nr:hypothetical protein [Candidatus Binataceae bacterium]
MTIADGSEPFVDIPVKAILPAVAIAIAVSVAFDHFGRPDAGRIAGFAVIALVGVIARCRRFWKEPWFLAVLFGVVLLHAAVIVSVQWGDPHYPALALAPFAFVDYFAIMKPIDVIYRKSGSPPLTE